MFGLSVHIIWKESLNRNETTLNTFKSEIYAHNTSIFYRRCSAFRMYAIYHVVKMISMRKEGIQTGAVENIKK